MTHYDTFGKPQSAVGQRRGFARKTLFFSGWYVKLKSSSINIRGGKLFMLKMYRSTYLFYWFSVIFPITLVILFGANITYYAWDKTIFELTERQVFPLFGLKPWHPAISVFVFIFSFVVFGMASEIYARKKHNKIITTKLYNECDPQNFLQVYKKIVGRGTGKMRSYTYYHNSSGYFYLGDFQTARQQLDMMFASGLPKTKEAAQYLVFYHISMCDIFLFENDIDNAEKALSFAMESVKAPKLLKMDKTTNFGQHIMSRQIRLNMEKGNYDGAEQFFTTAFELSDTTMSKVVSKFHLGRVYLHSNRIEEAKAAFEYVINNGNKIFYVNKSIEFLNQCT